MTLTKALSISRELKARYDADPQVKELIDMSSSLKACRAMRPRMRRA